MIVTDVIFRRCDFHTVCLGFLFDLCLYLFEHLESSVRLSHVRTSCLPFCDFFEARALTRVYILQPSRFMHVIILLMPHTRALLL